MKKYILSLVFGFTVMWLIMTICDKSYKQGYKDGLNYTPPVMQRIDSTHGNTDFLKVYARMAILEKAKKDKYL